MDEVKLEQPQEPTELELVELDAAMLSLIGAGTAIIDIN
jgi:hypothetical protein